MPDRPSLFDSPDLTYRMSMLPGATYRNPDGSERLEWALPSMITEPIDALYRLGQNSVLPDGRPGIPNPQNVENQNDVLTGLLSLYGGNAMNPGRLLEGAAAKAEVAPQRMYHGTASTEDFSAFRPSESGALVMDSGPYSDNIASIFKPGSVRSTTTGETLFSDTGRPSLFGSAIAGAKRPQGFDVWHGSPHDFDKFDISKIGTGEGAQAYGHGLYFAEAPGVAKDYQKSVKLNPLEENVSEYLDRSRGDVPKAIASLDRYIERGRAEGYPQAAIDDHQSMRDFLASGNRPSPGYLYQARINANPEDFLSLEGRFGEQSPNVQNALTTLLAERQPGLDIYPEYRADGLMNVARMRPEEISSALKDRGVPGLSYFDAGSRSAKEGSRNYVLFSDEPASILHKWRGDTQLYSDTGLPSLFGSALAPYQQEPRNALLDY